MVFGTFGNETEMANFSTMLPYLLLLDQYILVTPGNLALFSVHIMVECSQFFIVGVARNYLLPIAA